MITIEYDFKNREPEDLARINAMLGVLQLENLEIQDFRGYLATTRDGEGNLLHKRYGLDKGRILCTEARKGNGYTYQIDTVVVEHGAGIAGEEYLDCWRENHPDRVIRIAVTVGFDGCDAYTIVHHGKQEYLTRKI